jgi:ribosomal protein S18 acetylase RimI-like enzyme
MERITGLIEDNAAELLLQMGAAGGGVQRDDAVRWTIGGSPIDYHNAVVAASLDESSADRVIAESLEALKAHGVPGCWHVGPSMRPLDLGERLLAAGFTYGGSEPGMALRLADLGTPAEPTQVGESAASLPDTLRVVRVSTTEQLDVWVETLGQGFGEGPREARWVGEVYRRLGLADPWRHYVGFVDDRPVGTATIFLTGDVAGVYFVMTVPEARRRGLGRAITQAALEDARASGAQYAVLGSSAAGRSVYASLGFREYCQIELYEWANR